jgi:hypothetical protein
LSIWLLRVGVVVVKVALRQVHIEKQGLVAVLVVLEQERGFPLQQGQTTPLLSVVAVLRKLAALILYLAHLQMT